MEKLIELLNEYQTTVNKEQGVNISWYYSDNFKTLHHLDDDDIREWDNFNWDAAESYVISKKFWFIKWLVENEKVRYQEIWYYIDRWYKEYDIDNLIMTLSIEDEPIDFLISLLK